MRRWVRVGLVLALLVAAIAVTTVPRALAAPWAHTMLHRSPRLLRDGVGLYPRAIRLRHSGMANGHIIAGVVTFSAGNGQAAIYRSADGGRSFAQVGVIVPPGAAAGVGGLCCGSLFELPRAVGRLPAGTLLWAAAVGQKDPPNSDDQRMSIQVWRSSDVGRSWSPLSSCATATNNLGLWEPELSVDAWGRLVCHFADETQPAHSQVIARVVSTNGRTWSGKTNTVAATPATLRPGMPVVRRLPNGSYYMVYEVCPVKSPYGCGVYYKTSTDGWDWGPAGSVGNRIQTRDGRFLAHTPTIAWAPGGRSRGRLLLVGQLFEHADGSIAAGNGATILVNTHNGRGRWSVATAPVAVVDAFDDPGACTNYSSTLVPSAHGRKVLEIATDYAADGVCKPFFATGPIAPIRRHHAAVGRRSRCRPSPQPSGGSHGSRTRHPTR